MAIIHKDISQLTQKSEIAGTEKIPVSDTEYVTPNQIAGLAGGGGDVPIATTQPAGGMLPNTVYDLGKLTSATTFNLAAASDTNKVNIWHWTFSVSSSSVAISWPSGLVWSDDDVPPTVNAEYLYEMQVRLISGMMVAYYKVTALPVVLPTGYTAHNWIAKTSGTAYIDTNYIPTTKPRVEVEIMKVGATVDADLFGCDPQTTNAYFIFDPDTSTAAATSVTVYYKYGNVTSGSIACNIGANAWASIIAADSLSVNGTVTQWATSWNFASNTGKFKIFGGRDNTAVNFRMRRLKLYDGDTLVRDMVPCENSSAVAGMYDLVGDTFYASAAAGQTFTVGD